jgi:uncharacterized protein YsxB (DUF464 family)
MIKASFFGKSLLRGFSLLGHSGYAENGKDIVCAAASSAAFMAANTITEILSAKALATTEDGAFVFELSGKPSEESVHILEGLFIHLQALSEQYPDFIEITIEE